MFKQTLARLCRGTMEYDWVIKQSELLVHATAPVDLKGIMLSEKDNCKGSQIVWVRYLTLSKWWNYGDRIPK